jgi:hypothetical protein
VNKRFLDLSALVLLLQVIVSGTGFLLHDVASLRGSSLIVYENGAPPLGPLLFVSPALTRVNVRSFHPQTIPLDSGTRLLLTY